MRRAVTEYGPPSGSCRRANRPVDVVKTVHSTPVDVFLAVTVTPVIPAPVLSRTMPRIDASTVWADIANGNMNAASAPRREARTRRLFRRICEVGKGDAARSH